MWFLNQFDTGSVAYNIPMAVRLLGPLDSDTLRDAVGDVIERHEALRTKYPRRRTARTRRSSTQHRSFPTSPRGSTATSH